MPYQKKQHKWNETRKPVAVIGDKTHQRGYTQPSGKSPFGRIVSRCSQWVCVLRSRENSNGTGIKNSVNIHAYGYTSVFLCQN